MWPSEIEVHGWHKVSSYSGGAGDILKYCEICSRLMNVSELTLRVTTLREADSLRAVGDFLLSLLSSLPSLSSLSLRECILSRAAIRVLFNSCSSLKTVSCKGCEDCKEPTTFSSGLAVPVSPQWIACDGYSSAVLDFLIVCEFGDGLPTHLHLGPEIENQTSQVRLLNAVKDPLKSLEMLVSWS